MIIMDLSQVMISNLMVQLGNHTNAEIEEDLLRHMILNSIRSYNQKFKNEFGEMIIACDAGNNWRRQVFPYYKANRRKNREKSEINWTTVFETLNKVRDELKDYFPYRVIRVDGAEADDVIGSLAQTYGNTNEPILILSGDKDFVQLQCYMNVKQFDPVQKKWRKTNDVDKFMKEHIIRGDTGDGVPNFLSADDTFVVGARQKPISQKKLDQWLEAADPKEFCDEKMLRGYLRNQQLVDLNFIPPDIKKEVLVQFEEQAGKGRDKLFNYFIDRRLKLLVESINEF
jgi:5'-3' exonuclease